jgi:hypothetical protein
VRPKTKCFVVLDGGQWKIRRAGFRSDVYLSQETAIEHAIVLAQADVANGKRAVVLVQGDDFLFQTHWTSDR